VLFSDARICVYRSFVIASYGICAVTGRTERTKKGRKKATLC
jgi:hypothetical protein